MKGVEKKRGGIHARLDPTKQVGHWKGVKAQVGGAGGSLPGLRLSRKKEGPERDGGKGKRGGSRIESQHVGDLLSTGHRAKHLTCINTQCSQQPCKVGSVNPR